MPKYWRLQPSLFVIPHWYITSHSCSRSNLNTVTGSPTTIWVGSFLLSADDSLYLGWTDVCLRLLRKNHTREWRVLWMPGWQESTGVLRCIQWLSRNIPESQWPWRSHISQPCYVLQNSPSKLESSLLFFIYIIIHSFICEYFIFWFFATRSCECSFVNFYWFSSEVFLMIKYLLVNKVYQILHSLLFSLPFSSFFCSLFLSPFPSSLQPCISA